MTRLKLSNVSLMLSVVLWGTLLGGIAYSHLVYFPVYLSALPDSAVVVNGTYGLSEAIFWLIIHPLLILSLVATLALNWRLRPRRKLVLISFAVYAVVLVVSQLYFIPELGAFKHSPESGLSPAEWLARAQLWQRLSWLRGAVCYAAFIPLLLALTEPAEVPEPRKRAAGNPPPFRRSDEVQVPTLPLPPPKDPASVENFLQWVAGVPRGNVDEVRKAISEISERSAASAALHEQLFSLPCTDVGRHLLLLSTIGELREPSSIEALERFAWLDDEHIFHAGQNAAHGPCDFPASGMLQARAAEMLAWVLQGQQDERVLRVIREHPLRPARAAAIDAYLFQRDDSPEAVEYLRRYVGDEDKALVGLPRRAAGGGREAFDRLADEHEARHPSEIIKPRQRGDSRDVR
jgi:hypothetical protein